MGAKSKVIRWRWVVRNQGLKNVNWVAYNLLPLFHTLFYSTSFSCRWWLRFVNCHLRRVHAAMFINLFIYLIRSKCCYDDIRWNLNQESHPVEVIVHRRAAVWKVRRHTFHQLAETTVRLRLCQSAEQTRHRTTTISRTASFGSVCLNTADHRNCLLYVIDGSPHRGLPPCRGGGAYAPMTRTIFNLKERS